MRIRKFFFSMMKLLLLLLQAKGVVNTAVSAAVQAVRGRGRGTLTRGAFVGATAAPGYIAPGWCHLLKIK
jgi:hypothetical protein